MKKKKVLLMILDGWGLGKRSKNNPIFVAETPTMDKLSREYPLAKLKASGEAVGLPKGTIGNSEVGHLNIGSGRLVRQDLWQINQACQDGSLARNKTFREALTKAKQAGRALHFIGLISEAGVHAHLNHLIKMCQLASKAGVKQIFIHAISDGRDSDPFSGASYLAKLERTIKTQPVKIASIIGRYYAMDRDKHYERTKLAYNLMVKGEGRKYETVKQAMREAYNEGESDEFIQAKLICDHRGKPIGLIKPDDVVFAFNFRPERLRQLTETLTQKNFPQYKMRRLPLNFYTLTEYDKYKNVGVVFRKENLINTLGEVLAKAKKRQLRIAETEKYAHVTFFFSGGREQLFPGEERILVPSPRVATYDLKPEMSANKISQRLIKEMKADKFDFICLNFANGDMVGHTGNFEAIVKAVETVDQCLAKIIPLAQTKFDILVTADHGNAEVALNKDGSVNTAHSLNLVPLILISQDYKKIKDGALYNLAPTILELMGIKAPPEMTAKSLL